MLRPFDLAARSLLIVGGLNCLSVAAGKLDLVAEATRSKRGNPGIAARVAYGVVGAGALWSLARLIEQEAFPRRPRSRAEGHVREAMTAELASVEPSATAAEAARLLAEHDVGSLPVVEDGRLVGVVTDRDLALRIVAEGRDPNVVRITEIASRDLVTVEPEERLDKALHLMAKRQVRRLPVVEGGRLVGILAQADVALETDAESAGETVERISR